MSSSPSQPDPHSQEFSNTAPARLTPSNQKPEREDYINSAKAVLGIVKRNEQIRSSEIDPVTGLPNRVVFERDLDAAVERAHKGNENLLLGVFDGRQLKVVNDEKGPPMGDDYLRRIASGIKAGLRDLDKVYRIGGDEFALLVPNYDSDRPLEEFNTRVAEKVDMSLADAPYAADMNVGIYGVSGMLEDGETREDFYKRVSDQISVQKRLTRAEG